MASEDEGFSEAEASRLDKIEATQEQQSGQITQIMDTLAKLIPTGSHTDAQERTERRLDRPSTIEEQVREELAKRDRQAADAKDREDTKAELADLRAKLTEAKPEPPESRAKVLMWGRDR